MESFLRILHPSAGEDRQELKRRCWSFTKDRFSSLNTSPREIYVVFLLKFFESYGYFALSQILVIYLHSEFGTSDVASGTIYGMWGLSITFWGVVNSFFNDRLGVRKSLLIGFSISTLGSLITALTRSRTMIIISLFCINPIGTSMGIPMLTIGIKRYTTILNRGFAFGLYYSVMNIAAFVSGFIVDFFNIGVGPIGSLSGNRLVVLSTTVTYISSFIITYLYMREIKVMSDQEQAAAIAAAAAGAVAPSLSVELSSSNSIRNRSRRHDDDHANTIAAEEEEEVEVEEGTVNPILLGIIGDGVSVGAAVTMNDGDLGDDGDIEMSYSGDGVSTISSISINKSGNTSNRSDLSSAPGVDRQNNARKNSAGNSAESSATGSGQNTAATDTLDTVVQSSVMEYVPEKLPLLKTIVELVKLKTLWRFSALTLFLINLNGVFRHLDATLPTYLIRSFGPNYPKGVLYSINPFMIIWLTPFVAAVTSTLPHFDMIKYGSYVTGISPFFMCIQTATWSVVCFMVFLSLGEAIWSPRLYDYTMTIAPEGREATFSALAAAPLFAAKIPVGLLSGYLLQRYMPEDGSRNDGKTLWLIVGLLTISSAILVTLFESCVREPDKVPSSALGSSGVSGEEDSLESSNSKHALLVSSPSSSSANPASHTGASTGIRQQSKGSIAGHSNYGRFSIIGDEDEDEDEEHVQ